MLLIIILGLDPGRVFTDTDPDPTGHVITDLELER
jgi:hypothetical protein